MELLLLMYVVELLLMYRGIAPALTSSRRGCSRGERHLLSPPDPSPAIAPAKTSRRPGERAREEGSEVGMRECASEGVVG